MPDLVVGPLLRYVDASSATVWVETSARCTVTVLGHPTPTFEVAGHHFAIAVIRGLETGASYPYSVELDGTRAWPPNDLRVPASVIATAPAEGPIRIAFGSCRVAAPHEGPFTSTDRREKRGRGLDALHALATRVQRLDPAEWPHALLFLGDQVYADDVSPGTRKFIHERRGDESEPRGQVADFEEYTVLYREAWTDPVIRWLLSTIPSAMIFDDHDIHDDWNTSADWREMMWEKPWWRDRIVGGLVSYWVYQHLGNLSPDELEADTPYRALSHESDNEPMLREFALRADLEPSTARWSYRRDWRGVTLLMIDSRASRVVAPGARDMLDEEEWRWLEQQAAEARDHLLLGTSLPYLLPPFIHDAEAWDEALCAGALGRPGRWIGERLRQAVDLEHWAAFQASFGRLTELVRRTATASDAPATIGALSGDVHYAYVAEAELEPEAPTVTRIYQAVCSPLRNNVERKVWLLNKFAASSVGQWLGRRLARATGTEASLRWRVEHGPWFGNEIATVTFEGRNASFLLERPVLRAGKVVLEKVDAIDLTALEKS